MKKILSFLGTITLIGTSTTSLVACNTPQQYDSKELEELKEKYKVDTKNGVLEWISPQEKPFNKVDNKYYYIIWRTSKEEKWEITKFKNDKNKDNLIKIIEKNNWSLCLNKNTPHNIKGDKDIILFSVENTSKVKQKSFIWKNISDDYFKSVYRWNYNTNELNLIIDDEGNIKN